ncbi:urease accessory protein UreF [Sinomonas mesophila]|uniref:urease accessory protein UreF n=1 Tax=Sinomonas mesophila TaxID=1531955 RepID=UPI00318458F4
MGACDAEVGSCAAEMGSCDAEVGACDAEVGSPVGPDLAVRGPQFAVQDPHFAVRGPHFALPNPHFAIQNPHLGDLDDAAGLDALRALDVELTALLVPAQIRQASLRMGRRLLEIAAENFASDAVASYAADVAAGTCAGHYPIAFALAGAGQGIDEETLVEAYLYSTLTSLTQNAVRAIPLGQLAGQRVLGGLRAHVPAAVVRSRAADPRHFGAAAPALEIHQMRHEHQRARMFAS